jgi:hypothetical protein
MGLVKYIDLEDNLLTDNIAKFTSIIYKKEGRNLDYYLLLRVVELMTKCIEGEFAKIRMDVLREDIWRMGSEDEKQEQNRRLLLALEEMEKMTNLSYEVDFPSLKNRSAYYEPLLYFFGRTDISEDISYFININKFPMHYRENNCEKLSALSKEMFANIKEATVRSIRLDSLADLTKEERAFTVSKDPSDKCAKINSRKKQQIALRNQAMNGIPESNITAEIGNEITAEKLKKAVRFNDENNISWVDRVGGSKQVQNINL